MSDAHTQLTNLLTEQHVAYQLIHHPPEGRTDIVSSMRGHSVREAAKCLILIAKVRRQTRYILAVIPGGRRIDLAAIRQLLGARYVGFAAAATAERLTGTVTGTILPFVFNPELELIVDPAVLQNQQLYFNAARLDCSVVMASADYAKLTRPRLGHITSQSA